MILKLLGFFGYSLLRLNQMATPIISGPAIRLTILTFARFCRTLFSSRPPDA